MPIFSDDLKSRQDGSYINPNDADQSGIRDRIVNELDLSASLTAELHPYKKYVALLTQSGGDAPIAVVLENTFDEEIGWFRASQGFYSVTSVPNGIFLDEKVFVKIGIDSKNGGIGDNEFISAVRVDDDSFSINTYDATKTSVDGVLTDTPIEIRIYP